MKVKWINAKDKLPEPLVYVLVYTDRGDMEVTWRQKSDGNWVYHNLYEVLYWTELPDKPENVKR